MQEICAGAIMQGISLDGLIPIAESPILGREKVQTIVIDAFIERVLKKMVPISFILSRIIMLYSSVR